MQGPVLCPRCGRSHVPKPHARYGFSASCPTCRANAAGGAPQPAKEQPAHPAQGKKQNVAGTPSPKPTRKRGSK